MWSAGFSPLPAVLAGLEEADYWIRELGGLKDAVLHHACTKEFLDEAKDVAVGDLSGHRLHNDLVRIPVASAESIIV